MKIQTQYKCGGESLIDEFGNRIFRGEIRTEAIFDPSKKYRYSVKRTWDEDKKKGTFIMVNPNMRDHLRQGRTANEITNYLLWKQITVHLVQ